MNNTVLKIANNLIVPIAIMTSRIAAMGGNGSGKTYFVTKLIEMILKALGWVIILDPVGIHWGLRLKSDGKTPSGLNIYVFGGLHGDVILTPESGALVADLLVDRKMSAVLDVSQFTNGELNKFALAFGARFFQRMKAKKSAVLLVMEEAQEFIPQNPQKGEEQKLHIFSQIAKIGRNFGIGILMVSPRPQDISKKVFNLTQNMFAFQMTGLSERKTIDDWCNYLALDFNLGKTLPTLERGEPFVASPSFLKFSGQVKILPKFTYDSSSTPEFDEDRGEEIILPPLDLTAIEKSMQSLIQKEKDNNPAELRKRNAALERELAELKARPMVKTAEKIIYKDKPIILEKDVRKIESLVARAEKLQEDQRTGMAGVLKSMVEAIRSTSLLVSVKKNEYDVQYDLKPGEHAPLGHPEPIFKSPPVKNFAPVNNNPPKDWNVGDRLPQGEEALLKVIVQRGIMKGADNSYLIAITGYTASSVTSYTKELKRKGLIVKMHNWMPTNLGIAQIGDFEPLPTGPELHAYWKANLPEGESRIFEYFINIYPQAATNQDIQNFTQKPDGTQYSESSVTSYLKELRRKKLIVKARTGGDMASEDLFE